MNIAVVDYASIHPEAEFPWLKTTQEYRWAQYPAHDPAAVREDCWRAHVLVTVACPIDAETIAALPKLAYVIVASERRLVDEAAAKARGIEVIALADAAALAPAALCQKIVDELDALIASAGKVK
jgi:phosphoglycerate dehydrogenase-like enzyme